MAALFQTITCTMPGISQPLNDLEFADLIRAAQAGDHVAFDRLMMLYQLPVWKIACHTLGRPEDADDAVQEVFLRVYKYLKSYDLSKRFPPWLYGITDRVCKDLFKKKAQARVYDGELLEEAVRISARQQDDLIAGERRRILAEGLHRLPSRQRQALILRDIEGLTSPEAAEILGTDPATVRQQAAKALLKLTDFAKKYAQRSNVKVQR
jgi:RNA polymerase sigma-70 factor (ECF subfamily)